MTIWGKPMFRRSATAVVALTAAAALLTGCGGSSSAGGTSKPAANDSGASPAAELSSAVSALGQASTLTTSLKLDASGSELLDFVRSQDKSADITAQQANLIAGAAISFQVAAPSGKTLSSMSGLSNGDGAANISLSDNGKAYFTIRFVDKTLYVQADLKDFLNAIGQQETFRQIQSAGGQLPGFVSALVQGKWISLPLATLKSLSSSLGGGIASSKPDSSQAQDLLDKFKSLLTKDVTVTRASSGGTDTLTITTNLKAFLGDFSDTFASSIPGAGAALSSADLAKVPDKEVSIVATVSDGAMTGLSFDLGQLAKKSGSSLPLQLGFSQSGPSIDAPSGAVAVDLSQLGGLLNAFGGGSGL
ncbi:MAG TPA: hypothetical protein VHA79_10275 [Mycobacteriales bacterium]|nr:hypothetical protein [Mycobacteriales bacterium]